MLWCTAICQHMSEIFVLSVHQQYFCKVCIIKKKCNQKFSKGIPHSSVPWRTMYRIKEKFWTKTDNLCLNRAMKLLKLCPFKLTATQILFPVEWEVTCWWFHTLEANGFFDPQLMSFLDDIKWVYKQILAS